MENKIKLPEGVVDVVLDTDAYNEVDDQYAIAYLLKNGDRLRTVALYAAPFSNANAPRTPDNDPAVGMSKSFDEIHHILGLCGRDDLRHAVFRGSEAYLPDEKTPVVSDAARDLARRAMDYSPDKPLYVVAIGAITNVASAVLLAPAICERIVVVWLGGHALHWDDTKEYNMIQDVAAARVVFAKTNLVQLPCAGVVSEFRISKPELEYWLVGKNELTDYLAGYTIQTADAYAKGKSWTRVIWDVTAVAWLLNDDERFLRTKTVPVRLPQYDGTYAPRETDRAMTYVHSVRRDALMTDLIRKLTQ